MSDNGENGEVMPRRALRRTDGELILLWTLPVAVIIWVAGFVLFPGFNAADVAHDAGRAGCRVLPGSATCRRSAPA